MLRRLACCSTALLTLALVPVAGAAGGGPSPGGVIQGWDGVTGPGAGVRYVTFAGASQTTLAAVRKHDGRILGFASLAGAWGIPLLTIDGGTGGLSRDGRTLVLAQATTGTLPLRSETLFEVVKTRSLTVLETIRLRGDFSFDALSPDGHTLYLIQHVSENDLTRYVVRAYDLGADRLLARAIADRRQQGWVMRGYALTRTASADGRWVYTLYREDGNYPFIHALDTVSRSAVCIGLPWTGSQEPLSTVALRLGGDERKLAIVDRRSRNALFVLDTRSFRLSRPPGHGGAPAGLIAALAASLGLLAVLGVVQRRRVARVLRVLLAGAGDGTRTRHEGAG